MKFFEIIDNSSYERKWTRAVGIIPASHIIAWKCAICGRAAEYPSGDMSVELEGGEAFPDVLASEEYPMLIVSDRTLEAMHAISATGFCEYPVGVASIKESKLSVKAAPFYYRIEIFGACMVDLTSSSIKVGRTCPHCGQTDLDCPMDGQFNLINGSWDGSDVFCDRRYFPRVSFCTERVRDLLRNGRFTNLRFVSVS